MSTDKLLRSTALILAMLSTVLAAAAQQWTSRTNPPNNPDLYAVHFFTGRVGVVAGEKNGVGVLYRTTDSAQTWSANLLAGAPPVNDVYFVPGTSYGYAVGDGNFLAVSSDSGRSWTARPVSPTLWPSLSDLQGVHFKSPGRGFIVGQVAGANGPRMAQTGDTGKTWTVVPLSASPANNLYGVDFFDFLHGVAVGTGDPTRKSSTTDGGLTWEASASMGPQPQTESVSMYGLDAIESSGIAYAAGGKNYASPRYAVVRRTLDTGKTWSTLDFSTAGFTQPASDVLTLGRQVIFVSGQNGAIARSVDGATSWTRDQVPATVGSADLRRLSATPDNFLFAVGTSGHVLWTRVVPDVRYPSDPLDFGRHCPGSTATRTLQLDNVGEGMLTITGYSIVEPPGTAIWFEVVQPAPSEIAPRTSGVFRIRVTVPLNTPSGVHFGELRLGNNDDNGTSRDTFIIVPLRITIEKSAIEFDSAASRDAGRLRIGGSSALNLPGFLRNSSPDCIVNVDTVRLARGTFFTLLTPYGDTTLVAGRALDVRLRFIADSLCQRRDTLLVFHDGEDSPSRIPLIGTGVAPLFSTNPSDSLRVGSTLVGTPVSATLDLLNRDSARCADAVALRAFTLAGPNAAEFSVAPTFDASRTVIPADSLLRLTVTATPAALGPRIAYAITRHEASTVPDTVVLVAVGIDAALAPMPGEIVFPPTDVGGVADTVLAAALRNLGASPISFTAVSVVGGDAGMFAPLAPSVPGTIPGGASDTLAARFQPSRAGSFQTTLRLRTDRGGDVDVVLRGQADTAAGSLAPDSIDFGAVAVLACRDTVVEHFVANPGAVPLRIRGVALLPHPSGAAGDETMFSVLEPSGTAAATLAPGDSLRFWIRFCPASAGDHIALLRVTTNDPRRPLECALRGIGVNGPSLTITPRPAFPVRARPTRTVPFVEVVRNNGDRDARVDSVWIGQAPAYAITTSLALPVTLAPGDSLVVGLTFTPDTLCDHPGWFGLRALGLPARSDVADTIVPLDGIGVLPALRLATAVVDFGVRTVADPGDTIVVGFLLNGDAAALRCVDSIRIDSVRIAGRDAVRYLLVPPLLDGSMLAAGSNRALALRLDTRDTGTFLAMLEVYADGRSDTTLQVALAGVVRRVAPPTIELGFDLGPDQDARPGDLVTIPLRLTGPVADANLQDLRVRLSFHRSLLRPERLLGAAGLVATAGAADLTGTRASIELHMTGAAFTEGEVARLESTVLLGDVLESSVVVDSAWVESRPEIQFARDSASVSIAAFCDAQGRLVRFAGAELLRVSPNAGDGEVQIDFVVVSSSRTRLAVVDAAGRTHAVLFDGTDQPGTHAVRLSTLELADGTYFVVLTFGRFSETRELRVVR